MELPEGFDHRRFAQWNEVLRGLVEVWELARRMGWQEEFERFLALTPDDRSVELVARIGNDFAALTGGSLLAARPREEADRPLLPGSPPAWFPPEP
jgi:hypothetical protein